MISELFFSTTTAAARLSVTAAVLLAVAAPSVAFADNTSTVKVIEKTCPSGYRLNTSTNKCVKIKKPLGSY